MSHKNKMLKQKSRKESKKFTPLGDKKSYSSSYILKNIILTKKEIPKIILLVGPCRSGTTALLKVFSAVTDKSFYQPIKSLLRNGEPQLTISEGLKTIIIKETLGTFKKKESTINFLEILLKAKIPKNKIIFIPLIRDPIKTYDSWLEYSKKTNTKLFILAYKNTLKMYKIALKKKIKTIPLTYELFKKEPNKIIEYLFDQLGFKFRKSYVKWKTKVYKTNKIILNKEATVNKKYTRLFLDCVAKRGKFKYVKRKIKFISNKDKKEIVSKLGKSYKRFSNSASQNFIKTNPLFKLCQKQKEG